MRDQRAIETEIKAARVDLEASLGELKEVMQDKLDIKKRAKDRAHELVDRGKHQASDLAGRARTQAIDVVERAKQVVRERPVTVVLVVTGVIAVTAFALVAGYRIREHRRHVDPIEWLRLQLGRLTDQHRG